MKQPKPKRQSLGQTLRDRYGEDYYKIIGALGGRKSRTGGFFANPKLAAKAGKIGGKISKRGPVAKA